jgi:hypothetical protein
MQRFEELVAELRQHQLLDQLMAQFSAASVGEHHLLVIGQRQRARAQQCAKIHISRFGVGRDVR